MIGGDLTYSQAATVLNDIMQQATGTKQIAPVNATEFISVAQTALKMGYDMLLNSISQVLTRTLFSARAYQGHFKDINVSRETYGNHIRKINYCDDDFDDENKFELVDGESIDMYKIKKGKVLQTNYYGGFIYKKFITIPISQLHPAFSSPEEFARFISGHLININNQIVQAHENSARICINNFTAGKIAGSPSTVIHLLTEYNAVVGGDFTKTTIRQPENWTPFVKWIFGKIQTYSDLFTERTNIFHSNITGKIINRHTPKTLQRFYVLNQYMNEVDTEVLPDIYNLDFLRLITHGKTNFWQNINSPSSINIKPVYIDSTGTPTTPDEAINVSDVFGVLFDWEALGYTTIYNSNLVTPVNADGEYYNMYWHFNDRYWNDFTENGVVFLID